jgi:hypothetical protein
MTGTRPLEATHLYREIHEQPAVLARVLMTARPAAGALAAEIEARGIGHVVIAARGTSDNAARYAQYLLGAANGLVVALATPSLFTVYQQPPRIGDSLVLGISQSGRSPDIVAVLAEGRRQGALTAALTNDPQSDLAAAADHVIDLQAGEERSLAATKTYTAELAAIALLSVRLGDHPKVRSNDFSDTDDRPVRSNGFSVSAPPRSPAVTTPAIPTTTPFVVTASAVPPSAVPPGRQPWPASRSRSPRPWPLRTTSPASRRATATCSRAWPSAAATTMPPPLSWPSS